MRRDYPVEETGDFQRAAAAVGLDSAPSSNEAGPSDQAAPTNTTTESALGLDINPPPAPRLPFVPPPPPPPLPNSVSNSNALPNRLAGSSVPLVPVRRASQGPTPVRPQPSSGANPVPESYRVGSATTPRASLYPPRQGSYGSTAPIPFSGAPTTPTSYATQPYQLSSTSAPQTFASPLPMSSYMASPAPTPYQSPAAFPPAAPFPPRSQRPSTSPALQTPYSSYGSSSVNYPSQPIPGSLGSQRPATTTGAPSAPQTPASQSMYGTPAYSSVPQRATISSAPQTPGGSQSMYGKSPAYGGSAPQQSSARPQSYGGPTTPGAPLLPYANLPQQPIIGTGPITPGRRKTDAFVANDPFRPQHSSKHNKRSDDLTFDDIPVAGATVVSQPWTKYDSAAELPTAPYPSVNTGQQQTQPPPSVSWRPNQPSTYDPHQSSSNPPLTHPGSSQYPQASQPIYNRPSSATTSPMPYGGSPQYQPRPQAPPGQPMAYPPDGDPMGTSSPAPTGQPHVQFPYPVETAPQPTGPPAASSSNTSLEQPPTQPTPEPVMDAPGSGDSERPTTPVSRPSTPGDRPSDAYPPPRLGYPEYDPYDSSTFPGPPPIAMSPVIFYPPDAPVVYYPPSEVSESGYPSRAVTFVVQTMPREVYLHFLLRLPSLYFSRVARIFEEADLTLPEIKKMALETASQGKDAQFDIQAFESNVPPQYERLKSTWEAFIDSVMREWKTFNIISVLLLSAILTILQIQSAADDPLTRYFAVFSLICSLISLLFGCMYIIRFGSMRKTYKAAEWALEAKKSKTVIWWNVWVLLAMPVVWLTWSIMLYIACIMSFVWRTSAQDTTPPADLSEGGLLAVRVVITIVLGLGMLYGWLILSTFSRYGEVMDKAWKSRIDGWMEEKAATQQQQYLPPQPTGPYTPYPYPDPSSQTQPQYSQYSKYPYQDNFPGYRSDAPPYTQPYAAYPPDSLGPTYANEGYVPPPEPYDSPAGSPQSTSSTLNVTRANTQYNKTSGLQREDSVSSAYHGGYAPQHPLPPPPRDVQYSAPPPRLVPQKPSLAVPPGPNLPPIPGTPMTAFTSNRSSANPSVREGEGDDDDDNNSGTPGLSGAIRRPREDPEDAAHVRFRSPIFSAHSAQESFSFAGSDREAEEPLLSAGSGSSFMPRLSPVPSEHGDSAGRETDSLRRRRLG